MTQTPQGWYPDPGQPPGSPPQERYWDGEQWTSQTRLAEPPPYRHPYGQSPGQSSGQTYGQSSGQTYGQPYQPYGQAGGEPYGDPYGQPQPYVLGDVALTPDGVPLAGWWQRVGAQVIDWLILGVVTAILDIPFLMSYLDAIDSYVQEAMNAAETGGQPPSQFALYAEVWPQMVGMTVVGALVGFAYYVGFLTRKQATPGKMALGLKVRPRAADGPLTLGMVVQRWLVHVGVPTLGIIPCIGVLASLFALLDVLWPLWDDKKQALHEKWPGTNVVRTR